MLGRIVKGIAGFYYVYVEKKGLYECKAKGVFRNRKEKPLVGDYVSIDILDEQEKEGNIKQILERKNSLIRPNVANVDQAIVVFATAKPEPHLNLLDRFLIEMERQNIKTIICFNKRDIASEEKKKQLEQVYAPCGYPVIFSTTYEEEGTKSLKQYLKGKTTVLAGPSGVGKSSILNTLSENFKMETGKISKKIERGKHTTRHSQLIFIEEGTYIVDTPGFSSFYLDNIEEHELKQYFPEFLPYEEACRFIGCMHQKEPICGVKQAVADGKIHKTRYENYITLCEDIKSKKKW